MAGIQEQWPAALALGFWLVACQPPGTGLGINLVSEDQVDAMGQKTWQQLRQQTPVSDNANLQRAAERVGQRVLKAAGKDPSEWEITVFADDQVNAFALPGKKIGIYEGMFKVADTEAQLAAVIGHEIGHVDAEHALQRVNTQVVTELGTQIVGAGLSIADLGGSEQIAKLLGVGAQYGLLLPYSRNQELESDRLGVRYMQRAGYDPRAAIRLWEEMEARGGPSPPTFLSTHPAPEQRIEELKELLASSGR